MNADRDPEVLLPQKSAPKRGHQKKSINQIALSTSALVAIGGTSSPKMLALPVNTLKNLF
jgi:hypothetical protein